MKCIFSTTLEAENFSKSSWIETTANRGHWYDRTRFRHDRTSPVSVSSSSQARELGFATGASGPSWNWSARSRTQRTARVSELIGRGDASGHVRPDVSGRRSRSLDPYWTRIGRRVQLVRSNGEARPVTFYLRAYYFMTVGNLTNEIQKGTRGEHRRCCTGATGRCGRVRLI
jgi:hypothetical protein